MVQTAAHLCDHVFPRLPVRQWALSVPKRLLRYCVRPPFAMDRLRKEGTALVYRCAKQHSELGSDHGLTAGAARVSTWSKGFSNGRYLASCG